MEKASKQLFPLVSTSVSASRFLLRPLSVVDYEVYDQINLSFPDLLLVMVLSQEQKPSWDICLIHTLFLFLRDTLVFLISSLYFA